MEPRFDVRPEALQAILDELAANDARAKKIQPQQLIDRRYLEEMERSGFFDSLWKKIDDKKWNNGNLE